MEERFRGRRQTRYEPLLAEVATRMLQESGLSREEIARRSNISPEWIRQLLNLGRVISDDLLKDFAAAVGGDEDAILVAAGRRQAQPENLVAAVEVALKKVKGLSAKDMKQIMNVVEEISQRDSKKVDAENK